jgi:hypothetical protein
VQEPPPAAERIDLELQVLEHLERADEVERLRRDERLVVALDESRGADPTRCDGERRRVGFEADVVVPAREQRAHRSLPGAHLQNALDTGRKHPLDRVVAQPRVQREWGKTARHGRRRA